MVLNFLWSSPSSPASRPKRDRRHSAGPQIFVPSIQDLPAIVPDRFEGGDDEQEELRVRFECEGLRADEMTDAKKLVHVWRWLVDSETNCTSLRNQLDKLHKQQSAEMKEVESYIEHIQSLFEERVSRVQFDNRKLRGELELGVPSEITMAEIRRMLAQEGLADLTANMTLSEQVAFVLSERSRLKDELEKQREKELRLEENRKLYNNLPDSMKLSAGSTMDDNVSDNDDSSSSEGDYARIRTPPPSPPRRQSRIDSKRHMEDAVKRNIRDPGNIKPMIADKQWIKNLLQETSGSTTSSNGTTCSPCNSTDEQNANNKLQSRIDHLTDKLIQLEKSNRQLELDNETLAFKLSEALVQYDELEDRMRMQKENATLSPSSDKTGAHSRSQPESPVKSSYMQTLDNRISSSDLGLMDHCKKLHKEVISLQDQLYQTSHKLELLTVKYQEKKIKNQEKIHTMREQQRAEVSRLNERIDTLQTEMKNLQDEKKNLLKSLLEREEGLVTRAPESPPRDVTSSVPHSHPHVPTRL